MIGWLRTAFCTALLLAQAACLQSEKPLLAHTPVASEKREGFVRLCPTSDTTASDCRMLYLQQTADGHLYMTKDPFSYEAGQFQLELILNRAPGHRLVVAQVSQRSFSYVATEYALLRPEGSGYLVFDIDLANPAIRGYTNNLIRQGLVVLTTGGRYYIPNAQALTQLVATLAEADTPTLVSLTKSRKALWLSFASQAEGEASLAQAHGKYNAEQDARKRAAEAEAVRAAAERAAAPPPRPATSEDYRLMECETKKLFRKPFDPPDFYCPVWTR